MRKLKSMIMTFILSMILLCGIFVPCMPNVAIAEEAVVKHSLISPNYNANSSETLSKYNIASAQTSGFTPFDFETEERMDGMSFMFVTSEDRKQIENQYVLLDEVASLEEGKDYSLGLWIYFDNIYLHNLEITLELANSCRIYWYFTATDLYSLVSETGSLDIDSLPYGYVHFDIPFEIATISGEIYDSGYLVSPTKMIVNYTSNLTNVENFSTLRFYDLYIAESENKSFVSVERQDYRLCSVNFFSSELLDSLIVGDTITLPTKEKAINYAWNGASDLYELSNRENPNVIWKVLVKTPASEDNLEYKNFGDTITLSLEGTYEIYYQCYDTVISNDKYIISSSVAIDISKLNAVNFGTALSKIEVGKTYVLNLTSSMIFKDVSDFSFISSSEGLSYEYLGSGVIEITATKAGKHTLTASVNASREVDKTVKEYSSSITFEAVEPKTDDNAVLKVVLWSVLGVMVLALLIFGIKTLVKAHKYDVK